MAADDVDAVALEACEFWLACADAARMGAEVREHVAAFLPRLVPSLVSRMAHSARELERLDRDEQAGSEPQTHEPHESAPEP